MGKYRKYIEMSVVVLAVMWFVNSDPLNLGIKEKLGL